jgi:hypothetical protein
MMKEMNVLKLIILAIFSFSLAALAKAPSSYTQLRFDIQKISQKELVQVINQFVADSSPSRMVGMPGHEKAVEFIQGAIKSADPKSTGKLIVDRFEPDADEAARFYQNDFDQKVEGKISRLHPDYQKWLKFTSYMKQTAQRLKHHQGTNLTWEKSGLDSSKVLVISAHYDTISHDPNTLLIMEKSPMPGANYNATGVAIALSLIKLLSQMDLNYSVQVTFLDWQGIGFLGSNRYAQELKKTGKNVMGFLNLEMLGQDSTFFDKTKKNGNMSVYFRPQDQKFIQVLETHGKKLSPKITFIQKPTGFENSDNFRFWEYGLTGGTFSQNWEDDFNPKFYQTPQDTPETLNHQTLYSAYEYLAGAVAGTLLDLTK